MGLDAAEVLRRLRAARADAPPPSSSGMSLDEARGIVQAGLADGVSCPCCGQLCKRYARKFYADMAAWLIWLVRRYAELTAQGFSGWVNVTEYPLRGGDYGKLQHWGLCELAPKGETDNKRTSGIWRPTEKGIQFVLGEILVPSHVILFNNEIEGWSEDLVGIHTVLGEQFDYNELMSGNITYKSA